MAAIPSPVFTRVTSILEGVAAKLSKLDSDPEVKKAADYWRAQFEQAQSPAEAVSFAREEDEAPGANSEDKR